MTRRARDPVEDWRRVIERLDAAARVLPPAVLDLVRRVIVDRRTCSDALLILADALREVGECDRYERIVAIRARARAAAYGRLANLVAALAPGRAA